MVQLYRQVVKTVEEGSEGEEEEDGPLLSSQFPIEEEEAHHDDRGNQIRQDEADDIHHILLHGFGAYHSTTAFVRIKVGEGDYYYQKYDNYQRRYIGHNHIFQHEVDEVEVLAWCQFFSVDEASDEDDPKVGSNCEGESASQTDDTEHSVYVLDIAEHLEHRLQDFIEDENGQHLHDGDAGRPPPEEVESKDDRQAQGDDGWHY